MVLQMVLQIDIVLRSSHVYRAGTRLSRQPLGPVHVDELAYLSDGYISEADHQLYGLQVCTITKAWSKAESNKN